MGKPKQSLQRVHILSFQWISFHCVKTLGSIQYLSPRFSLIYRTIEIIGLPFRSSHAEAIHRKHPEIKPNTIDGNDVKTISPNENIILVRVLRITWLVLRLFRDKVKLNHWRLNVRNSLHPFFYSGHVWLSDNIQQPIHQILKCQKCPWTHHPVIPTVTTQVWTKNECWPNVDFHSHDSKVNELKCAKMPVWFIKKHFY